MGKIISFLDQPMARNSRYRANCVLDSSAAGLRAERPGDTAYVSQAGSCLPAEGCDRDLAIR